MKYFHFSEVVKYLQILGDNVNTSVIMAKNSLKKGKRYSEDPIAQFKRIAWQIIRNGINWGRIAVIFSLGAVVVKDIGENSGMSIFHFLMEFIKTKLFSWIVYSGGWVRIYFVSI